ncbi:hypothetical protein MHU86_12734 [Fragilaria crotonensis]|nr:hypothetical protein MHU86_12734 [Fragilaria crotonensis]
MESSVPLLEGASDVAEERSHASSAVLEVRHFAAGIRGRCKSMQISWSNIFFLSGSVVYVFIAMWDLTSPGEETYDHNRHVSLVVFVNWSLYDVLTTAAPFMYIMNAVCEFQSAFVDNLHWELAVSTIFGMAALMDMVGALVADSGSVRLDTLPSIMAVHFYFIQAVLAFSGSSFRYENHIACLLQCGGYLLFLVGSFIDVMVSYMDGKVWNVAGWGMVSSSLWLLDALFFIVADLWDQ